MVVELFWTQEPHCLRLLGHVGEGLLSLLQSKEKVIPPGKFQRIHGGVCSFAGIFVEKFRFAIDSLRVHQVSRKKNAGCLLDPRWKNAQVIPSLSLPFVCWVLALAIGRDTLAMTISRVVLFPQTPTLNSVVATQILCIFTPKIGEDVQFGTRMFQVGWNHQPVK